MAISIDWAAKVIQVPQADLTPLGGNKYELDIDAFRLTLKSLEDDEDGMPFARTHNHTTETTLAGITFARAVEVINGYTVEFEDGQYTVNAVGANSNLADVKVANQVSLNTANAAGLVVVTSGGSDMTSIGGDSYAATALAASAQTMASLTVLSGFTPTTTQFECDLDLTHTDQVKGRGIIWRTGTLLRHAARIDGYTPLGGRGRLTVKAMPAAPSVGDQFVRV